MNRFDSQRRRLGWLLAGIFAALVCASAVLTLQSVNRLRLESFISQRSLAEEVAARVDSNLRAVVAAEDARPPTDYDFLVISGERYVQRSPLSSLTPQTRLPGVIGYFQVDADGRFSTPLLPADAVDPQAIELTESEFAERQAFQGRLRRLLEKVQPPPPASEDLVEADGRENEAAMALSSPAPMESSAYRDEDDASRRQSLAGRGLYDQLAQSAARLKPASVPSLGRVAELELEESLAKRAQAGAATDAGERVLAEPKAERRREVRQVTVAPADVQAPLTPRVSAFHSAVDPFSLALLDARHVVLYRKVWLEGQRVQGAVLDLPGFLDTLVGGAFTGTALAQRGDLRVALQGDVIRAYPAAAPGAGAPQPGSDDSLLLRTRLAAPGDALELIFSIDSVPLGPGASTVLWAAAVMALVLCGGFVSLWYLGRHHIRLAEQQQDFVSAVSHELKTPLTSIRMYGEILKAGWADEEKKRSYYDFILSESERLSRLIGNVLQLARITRNDAPQIPVQAVAVARLMDLTTSKVASALDAAGLTLEQVDEPEALAATVSADEDAFMQVMINLVDNAIKFSASAALPAIEVGCRLDRQWVEFRVRDFGPGVAREQMKKIFRLFYRPENELTRETVGTGIGLALVRELTDRMGGSVDVVNRDPGAEFRVRLRRVAEPANG